MFQPNSIGQLAIRNNGKLRGQNENYHTLHTLPKWPLPKTLIHLKSFIDIAFRLCRLKNSTKQVRMSNTSLAIRRLGIGEFGEQYNNIGWE